MKKITRTLCFVALLVTAFSARTNAQNIMVSLAGSGTGQYTGDGGMGFMSQVYSPTDVCADAAHNIYIADNGNGVVRKISAKDGVITTYAGGGASTADGVPATSAALSPAYMCIDAAGNLYMSTGNQVRVVSAATGLITTVAGTGTAGYSGDGGLANAANLNQPGGICLDAAGNIYVVDGGRAVWSGSGSLPTYIRKITAATGIITTIAGTSTPGYSGDGGLATAAQIQSSIAICVNAAGDIYFSDQPGALSFGGGGLSSGRSAVAQA